MMVDDLTAQSELPLPSLRETYRKRKYYRYQDYYGNFSNCT